MERKTFSCYDNFVSSNSVGAPTHDPGATALSHLATLVPQALRKAQAVQTRTDQEFPASQSCEEDNIDDSSQLSSSNSPLDSTDAHHCATDVPKASDRWSKKAFEETDIDDITLIGFSKGCVVLNQIITELHALMAIEVYQSKLPVDFIDKVRHSVL